MTRTNRRRHCLPAVTRRQYRTRVRDMQDQVRQTNHQLAGAERRMADAERHMSDQRDRIAELEAENARLRAERVDVGVLRQQLATCEKAYTETNSELLATRAELQNATRIDVPPMVRDTDPGEQATEPIYVQKLRDSTAARETWQVTPPVRPLAEALGSQR